ncbi:MULTISPECIES: archaetidylserine decarboxylase [Thermoactinomyces]|uniref:Phosphatidylserine decarboxylase proenzyme n=1 Tax=Thermoactinomyces daqus TaxID=1329516 RepID=A0A7W2AHH6_9BACL|nr:MULTISPECIES: archaetidylserine decarboxylase [Thermoactinomyces]MBA4541709.1 phosphatidylserine decarboxylase [Thermoactinomyces daqus]MBH8597206.1 phosphatidylserine decarboxylase [Thermoactinomyces sp. CICC 10523]MBH8602766.1 phosphatidylserine decarboxylase [Thermoactinomyces sp. CICC 10522]MBH8606125.1 phosphatidylserine decarboxylase [Thermoactinomyces sp. CICC 10521]
MKQTVSTMFWRCLPKKAISRLMGKFARHPLSRHLIPVYIRYFDIDLEPVRKPLHEFQNLLDFFVRELTPEARPIAAGDDVIVSPVDGTVSQAGQIEKGTLIQAKGVDYSLDQLLNDHPSFVRKLQGGQFLTIYLSPRDYHRIHMPVEGVIRECSYIPGELYPVNETGVNLFPGLFTINERIVSYIETQFGWMALVKVGATNVGSIKVEYDDNIVTNPDCKCAAFHKCYQSPQVLDKGAELGRFEFGSTVILLFEPKSIKWMISPEPGIKLKMGQAIAEAVKKKEDDRDASPHVDSP